jgi:hypothetical protein
VPVVAAGALAGSGDAGDRELWRAPRSSHPAIIMIAAANPNAHAR